MAQTGKPGDTLEPRRRSCWKAGNSGWSRERREGRLGGGRAVCRQELGGPAAAGPRLPSPSPPAQLGLLRPSSDGELSRGKVEPREPRPTSHTFAPGQKGRGRGRSAGWVRAAASGGGSVDSWNRLLRGFALVRGDCRRAAQDPGVIISSHRPVTAKCGTQLDLTLQQP